MGTASISWLLSVPGASATILEATVPYARDSLISILGQEPEQYCSAATAAAMAEAAYRRAADLSSFGSSVVGLGATCSLATVDMKRGDHRAFLAVHAGQGSRCLTLTLAKGFRTRVGEDDLVSRLLIKILAEASGSDSSLLQLPLITPDAAATTAAAAAAIESGNGYNGTESTAAPSTAFTTAVPAARTPGPSVVPSPPYDTLHDVWSAAEDPVQRLLRGEVRCVEFCGREVVVDSPRRGRVYLPGSFNPLHAGHRELLATGVKAAAAATRGPLPEGAFELTVQNADKGLLSAEEIRRRVAQFVALGLPVVVTRAPLFTNKADLLRGSRFVVGYDTAARLVLPKYYGNSYTQMLLDFSRLRQNGCSFIVAGRKDAVSGRFLSLADVDMVPELADLFPVSLTEEKFRLDISSTELRQKAQVQ
ncbi:hypothetical protein Vafri_6129 [Volvox africanus]|uniref:Cytidyltransferase-like domain-containing protein n=1 Tax=Volvox africanus TaxID=51714 RepID=A0A8J4EZ53_9CHLO|nr:hypothetical protein Vafri_6129 [Volvox africanus]